MRKIFDLIAKNLAVALAIALFIRGHASAAPLVTFDFEDGSIPAAATTYGNVDVVTEVAKQGINLACYGGNFCLRMAPGQGPRNYDAGIEFTLPDIRTGDTISFGYVVIPEINNDFAGFSLTGPGFFDWVTLPPIDHWTIFSYIVPDLSGGGGPSLMTMASADWTITVWVENTIGDPNRTSLWIDSLGITRAVPEPHSLALFGIALLSIGIVHRKR